MFRSSSPSYPPEDSPRVGRLESGCSPAPSGAFRTACCLMIRLIVGKSASASRPTMPFSLICEVSRIGDKSRALFFVLLSSKTGVMGLRCSVGIFCGAAKSTLLSLLLPRVTYSISELEQLSGFLLRISVEGSSNLFCVNDLSSLMWLTLYDG